MPAYNPPTAFRELSDDQRNQLWELRFEACTNDEDCVHAETPYGPGTSHHYDTCPRAEENQ